MIKAVLIEDEPQLMETNRLMLKQNFPNIKIVGEADTVSKAINTIQEQQPQLVLLDIELADGNCFQVLNQCRPYTFKPVFITAYNHYAIKAIKFSAIDYILKPVNEFEFCNAINTAITSINEDEIKLQTFNFEQQYNNEAKSKKLLLRTADSLHLVDIKEIIFCRSDNSYTTFFLNDGQKIIVSRSIKEYEEMLSEHDFIRPHQSFLVNLSHVTKIDKTDGGFMVMKNKKEIPISSRRKQMVIDKLDSL
ncbi:LytR/AlgR family response regulator transcription factor [Plebeiibacterium sediminum]|uniref:LytTR family DNA-binding domain-containing protein n=1 Tax=Plebeiibacterium sediminum TaxID=2992112 RepID=A0AAE3M6E5_9BACT|nr:LytTR family DNA-binding domain-containing protein [Plebeiobacterium sediminum]MCW3788141.1 LytTR family DNA-binding domain-containing protein [Plebeiobacterium sediminum]